MAIDPRISLSYVPPQINFQQYDPLVLQQRRLTIQSLMDQGQLHQLQMQQQQMQLEQMRQALEERKSLADLFTNSNNPTPATPTTPTTPTPAPATTTPNFTPVPNFTPIPGATPAPITPTPAIAPPPSPIMAPAPVVSRPRYPTTAQILQRAPITGWDYAKNVNEMQKSDLGLQEQTIKTRREAAARLGSLAGSAKDVPSATQAVLKATSEGLFDQDPARNAEIGRQLLDHLRTNGFNQQEFTDFSNQAMTAAEQHTAQLADIENKRKALKDGWENASKTIGFVGTAADYPSWLKLQDEVIQKYLPPTVTDAGLPQLKGLIKGSGVSPDVSAREGQPQGEFERNFLPAFAGKLNKTVDQLTAPEKLQAFQQFKQGPPKSPEQEAQEIRIAEAKAAAEVKLRQAIDGMSPAQFQKVETIARGYDNHPLVKDFNTQANKYTTMKSLLDRKLGGPGDLAIIYDFMKALDPGSVVRESEYASAAKSGNIFAGALAKFNGYLKPEGGFLPENVKKSFLDIVANRMNVSRQQIGSIYKDYGRRIDTITGRAGTGTDYLTNYGELYQTDKPSPFATSAPPTAGTVIEGKGGQKYLFIGGDPNDKNNYKPWTPTQQ